MHTKEIVVITGGTGLLGLGLLKTAPSDFSIIPTYHKNPIKTYNNFTFSELDITNVNQIHALFKLHQPTVVIHTASIGNVDFCEKNRDEANRINVTGTQNIINACTTFKARLVFTSSNAVFDGLKAPYNENSDLNPVNYYGETKKRGEKIVQESGVNSAIVRLVLMYGWHHPKERANPVTWLIEKIGNNEPVKLVNDTYVNPLLNIQAAEAIWKITERHKTGVYHISGRERVNRYEFGLQTAEVFQLPKELIKSVTSDYFKGIAQRMPDTTYKTDKMEKDLGISPFTIHEGLTWMKHNKEVF